MSDAPETKQEVHADDGHLELKGLEEKNALHSDVLVDAHLMQEAFDGENREHEMGLWEAVKTHPMACLWAFIFCFTIVSELFALLVLVEKPRKLIEFPPLSF